MIFVAIYAFFFPPPSYQQNWKVVLLQIMVDNLTVVRVFPCSFHYHVAFCLLLFSGLLFDSLLIWNLQFDFVILLSRKFRFLHLLLRQ